MLSMVHLKFENLDCLDSFRVFYLADTAAQRLCKNKCKVNIPTECFWQRGKFIRSLRTYYSVQPKSQRCQHCSKPNSSSHFCQMMSFGDRFQENTRLSKFSKHYSFGLSLQPHQIQCICHTMHFKNAIFYSVFGT